MNLNPVVWGPNYWFFLYTIAINYSDNPNDILKKKYYDVIYNLPIFIPHHDISKQFSIFLEKYPVTPYLDSKQSLIKWVHFIHNKINIYLGKKELSYLDAMNKYYNNYKLKEIKIKEEKSKKYKYIFFSLLILLLIIFIVIIYTKN